jgi:hypothetical protein
MLLDLFSCFVDSSHGNVENGTRHGGFLIASCAPPMARPRPSAQAVRPTAPVAPLVPASTGPAPASELASHALPIDGAGGNAARASQARADAAPAVGAPAASLEVAAQ